MQGELSPNKDQARAPHAQQATFALRNQQLLVSVLAAPTVRVVQLTVRHAQPATNVQKRPLLLSNVLQGVIALLERHLVHHVLKVKRVSKGLITH